MGLKTLLKEITPSIIKTRYEASKDLKELTAIQQLGCDTKNLRQKSDLPLKPIFESGEIELLWNSSAKDISIFTIPDGSGGVNPGDRRALYYLFSSLKPASVLEIGTHIGASTLHIAAALYMSMIKNGEDAHLTTVDIKDVNDPQKRPWLEFGINHSPIEMINKLNYGDYVTFITDTSLHFVANCKQTFDFIFLDGSHAANIVYQEVPLVLKLLNQNGVILLHDYFPGVKPLWSGGEVIPGPFLATQRLIKEGVHVTVLPLGKLPWPTKRQSNVTSLALLLASN